MKQRFGFEATHVPYRNTPQSVTDIAAGHVAMGFAEAGAAVPLIKEGKLRALAVSSKQRLPILPEVPPFARSRERERLRGGVLARAARAGGNARGGHRPAASGDEAHHGGARHGQAACPTSVSFRSTRSRSPRHPGLHPVRAGKMGRAGEASSGLKARSENRRPGKLLTTQPYRLTKPRYAAQEIERSAADFHEIANDDARAILGDRPIWHPIFCDALVLNLPVFPLDTFCDAARDGALSTEALSNPAPIIPILGLPLNSLPVFTVAQHLAVDSNSSASS